MIALLWKYKSACAIAALCLSLATVAAVAIHERDAANVAKGVLQQKVAQLDSSLTVAASNTARTDTVRIATVKHFTEKVTQWKTDTVRLSILAQADTDVVLVKAYRDLSVASDSVIAAGLTVLAASDSSTAAERREKLLWKQKAELVVPTMRPREGSAKKWAKRVAWVAAGFALAKATQ